MQRRLEPCARLAGKRIVRRPRGDGRAEETGPDQRQKSGWLNRGVAGIGSASLLCDAGHEVPTALLPAVRGGRLVARPSFFQLSAVRKASAAGVPMHLIAPAR